MQDKALKNVILLIDIDPKQADFLSELFRSNDVQVDPCSTLAEVLQVVDSIHESCRVLAHCELLNGSFTQMAKLMQHPAVKMIFYCTDPTERSKVVNLLPQELASLIAKVRETR